MKQTTTVKTKTTVKGKGKVKALAGDMKVYMLLDRSQSMSTKWDETLGAINGYVEDLAKQNGVKADVTLAIFDHSDGMQFDVIRRAIAPKDWELVQNKEASPRGWTPLYDAIGKLVTIVEADNPKKAVLVIMTDGEENSSKEVTQVSAKAALDRCRNKNLQVVFLGVDFDSFAQASGLGNATGQTINTSQGSYRAAMGGLAGSSSAYACSATPINFSDDDRKKATGKI